jgi:hypothetical protein
MGKNKDIMKGEYYKIGLNGDGMILLTQYEICVR